MLKGREGREDNNNNFTGVRVTQGGQWKVYTLESWGVEQRILTVTRSREEAEAVRVRYFKRLAAAAEAGTFELEFNRVDAEIVTEVRPSIVNLMSGSLTPDSSPQQVFSTHTGG